MNKDTRTFIWGLIILIFSGIATAVYVLKVIHGDREWYNFVGFAICAPAVFIGLNKIKKTTD